MTKPFDRILVVDFETRWDRSNYTLSKMTTEEYIRDDRFKAFGIGWKEYGDDQAHWVSHESLPDWVNSIDWSRTAVLAHNAQFDVAILSWVYGAHPAFIFDSLSMARALRGVEVGNSLAKLAEYYELPPKGQAVYSTDGLEELPMNIEEELAEYCLHDVYLCEAVFDHLNQELEGFFPKSELQLIDLTLKMFVNPVLELDKEMLDEAIADERTKREAILAKVNVDETALASNDQFAEVLNALGVSPPKKS